MDDQPLSQTLKKVRPLFGLLLLVTVVLFYCINYWSQNMGSDGVSQIPLYTRVITCGLESMMESIMSYLDTRGQNVHFESFWFLHSRKHHKICCWCGLCSCFASKWWVMVCVKLKLELVEASCVVHCRFHFHCNCETTWNPWNYFFLKEICLKRTKRQWKTLRVRTGYYDHCVWSRTSF